MPASRPSSHIPAQHDPINPKADEASRSIRLRLFRLFLGFPHARATTPLYKQRNQRIRGITSPTRDPSTHRRHVVSPFETKKDIPTANSDPSPSAKHRNRSKAGHAPVSRGYPPWRHRRRHEKVHQLFALLHVLLYGAGDLISPMPIMPFALRAISFRLSHDRGELPRISARMQSAARATLWMRGTGG